MKIIGAESIPADVRANYIDEGLWNATRLADGVEEHARLHPAKVALIDGETRWTYGQLASATARATGYLHRLDINDQSVVLIIAPLIAPAVAAYHAVLRNGAVAVMLDRRAGRADVAQAMESAQADLVISTPELVEHLELAQFDVPVVTYAELLASDVERNDWIEPDPERPIAVVFTSGTTSRPKGVVHSLNTIWAGARNMAEAVRLSKDDIAVLSSPLASVTGLVQIHLTLDRGAALLLEDRFDAPESLARMQREGATVLGGAPIIVEQLLREAQSQDLVDVGLRVISLGGSMIPRPLLDMAVGRYGITPVRVYGSSEAPCATTTPPSELGERRLGDDGACARGTELRTDGPVAGELLVRGPVRFLGYLDPDDNAQTFSGGGWFRTGDLARYDEGRLTVTGRLKETVVRKGLKISLAEIDETASGLPGIEECVSFGLPDPDTGERLVLAIRPVAPDAVVEFDAVIGWLLAAGLAKRKLPEQIVVWDAPLPRTASGKIQRRVVADGHQLRPALLAPRLRDSD
ncbi:MULTISPECIES: class I adenylate-forming enzyme family protein [unclassified Mycobacterium]|uniref:class I adenylate-forming enzyme family protein n=1 Tax=unclassified Mycobacterium TaxID=2642494 RepID=UPI0029C723A6|nr:MULTISPECIES: class I adenylate-forming enzyme family protein [unclassified Mycobacterium]